MGWKNECRTLGFYALDRNWLKYFILFKHANDEKCNRFNRKNKDS